MIVKGPRKERKKKEKKLSRSAFSKKGINCPENEISNWKGRATRHARQKEQLGQKG